MEPQVVYDASDVCPVVTPYLRKIKAFIFVEGAKKEEGIEKEKIQISHLHKETGVRRNNLWEQY
jgi:hypothetical protein